MSTNVNPFFQTATMPAYLIEKRIIEQLTEVVNRPTRDTTLLGIKNCIDEGVEPRKIIREIQQLADHNYSMSAQIFGHHLLLTIVNHK